MKRLPALTKHTDGHRKTGPCPLLAFLMSVVMTPALAETITIGQGSGILWEGMPFSVTLSGALQNPNLNPIYGLLAISNLSDRCMLDTTLTTMAGYSVFKIAPGIGLMPRATGTARYQRYSGIEETLTGNIGLPQTIGQTSSGTVVYSPPGRAWCLPPAMTSLSNFYNQAADRTARFTGTWVLIADGTQKTSEVRIPAMYAGSFSTSGGGDKRTVILPADISLRISTLTCTVDTPTTIDFGTVQRNNQSGAELASVTLPLITTCTQPSDRISANINLQFRALTTLFGNSPSRLALSQGGGYITGEISNNVTGSGNCAATSGLPFDNTPLKAGAITAAQTSQTLANQVTWRLCSAGSGLPSGVVNASAEMLVTFN